MDFIICEFHKKRDHLNNILQNPFLLNYHITWKCNQKCIFCYAACSPNGSKLIRDSSEITQSELELLFDELELLPPTYFTIGGGEPFLRYNKIIYLLERMHDKSTCIIATNGTANGGVTNEQAKELSSYYIQLGVSLNALTPEIHDELVGLKGACQKAKQSIVNLIESKNQLCGICVTANTKNYKEILPLAKWLKNIGGSFIDVSAMWAGGEALINQDLMLSPDQYLQLQNELKEMQSVENNFIIGWEDHFSSFIPSPAGIAPISRFAHCGGATNLLIAPNGDVYPCQLCLDNGQLKLGNIKKQRIKSLFHSDELDFFRKRDLNMLTNQACLVCEHKNICKGGCPITAQKLSGDSYAGDPTCHKIYKYHKNM